MVAARSLLFCSFLVASTAFAGGYLAERPTLAAVFLAACAIAWVLAKLDGWQRLFALTLFALFCATSIWPQLYALGNYGRFIAAGSLAAWTFYAHRGEQRPVATLSIGAQWLLRGMYLTLASATLSIAWSSTRWITLQHAIALGLLVALVHGLVTRRWTDRDRIGADLAIAYVFLIATFTVGIIADRLAVDDTRVYGGRFEGVYINPNTVGLMCAVAIPLGWALYQRRGRWQWLLGWVPAIASIAMSESRTPAVAVAAGALWLVGRRGPSVAVKLGLTLVALGSLVSLTTESWLGAAFGGITGRFTDYGTNGLLNGRLVGWNAAVDLWKSNPIFGYGYSAGPSIFARLRNTGELNFDPDVVHNSYLQWLLETGFIGLIPMLVLVAACVRVIIRGRSDAMGAGLVWLTAAGLLVQVTESAMLGTGAPYATVFWVCVTAAVALQEHEPSGGPDPNIGVGVGNNAQWTAAGSASLSSARCRPRTRLRV
jgi:hypothetical protein